MKKFTAILILALTLSACEPLSTDGKTVKLNDNTHNEPLTFMGRAYDRTYKIERPGESAIDVVEFTNSRGAICTIVRFGANVALDCAYR